MILFLLMGLPLAALLAEVISHDFFCLTLLLSCHLVRTAMNFANLVSFALQARLTEEKGH